LYISYGKSVDKERIMKDIHTLLKNNSQKDTFFDSFELSSFMTEGGVSSPNYPQSNQDLSTRDM
jgi:hypothetical protein